MDKVSWFPLVAESVGSAVVVVFDRADRQAWEVRTLWPLRRVYREVRAFFSTPEDALAGRDAAVAHEAKQAKGQGNAVHALSSWTLAVERQLGGKVDWELVQTADGRPSVLVSESESERLRVLAGVSGVSVSKLMPLDVEAVLARLKAKAESEVDDGISPFTGEAGTQMLGCVTWGPEGSKVLFAASGEEENMNVMAFGKERGV